MRWTIITGAVLLVVLANVASAEGRKSYELAAKYHAATNGFSMLVMIGDEIVFEQYDNDFSEDDLYRLASGTKSFWGVAAVCAQQDGFLDLDEKVAATITRWKDHPRKSRITIRQLLNFTSGLDPSNGDLRGASVADKYEYALAVPAKDDPGVGYRYGASHLFVFGEVLQRKLKAHGKDETPLEYLKRRVLDPIGMNIGRWSTDQAGNPNMPFGAFLTAREWVKFGKLIRDDGNWNGKQVIPSEGLKQCFVGSKANTNYGLNWWLIGTSSDQSRQSESNVIPADAVAAKGAGKQRLYVIPSHDMVVVRQAETLKFDDDEFLRRLLYGKATLPDEPSGQARSPRTPAWFRRLDRNQDGTLTRDEMPNQLKERLIQADSDGNGAVSVAEVEKAMRESDADR